MGIVDEALSVSPAQKKSIVDEAIDSAVYKAKLYEERKKTVAEMPAWERALAAFGGEFLSSARGIGQAVGLRDKQDVEDENAAMRALYEEGGIPALAGGLAGGVADPVTIALPLGKAKSIAGMAAWGAVGGATSGALQPVDEEAGMTRGKNIAIGAAGGSVLAPVIGGATNIVRTLRGKERIPIIAQRNAKGAIDAGVLPSPVAEKPVVPQQVEAAKTPIGPKDNINAITREEFGKMVAEGKPEAARHVAEGILEKPNADVVDAAKNEIMAQVAKAPKGPERDAVRANIAKVEPLVDEAIAHPEQIVEAELAAEPLSHGSAVKIGKSPQAHTIVEELPTTEAERSLGERYFKVKNDKTGKVDTVELRDMKPVNRSNAVKLTSGIDPTDVPDAVRGIKAFYQQHIGGPGLDMMMRNPGTALSGVTGGVVGYQSADEEAPAATKWRNAALGAFMGIGAARGVNRIPGATDALSRAFRDSYGKPEDLIKLKQKMRLAKDTELEPFLDLMSEMKDMPPSARRTLYHLIQGEAPVDSELVGLSEKARKAITGLGQKMVDYGMLDEDTFLKNINSYLHREYLSKKSPAVQWASKKLKIIGDELKPRGVFHTVDSEEAGKWVDEGWEAFGKPFKKDGKQVQKIRRQLTDDERVAMGEIEDAAYAVARTGQLMANDVATFGFYDDIAKKADLSSKDPVDGWHKVAEGKVANTKINKYGNLEGRYVHPEVWRDLKQMDMAKRIKDLPGIKEYLALNSAWKVSKTALNPVVHMNNTMSNVALYYLSDSSAGAMKQATKELFGKGALYKEAQTAGVFDAGFVSQELSGESRKALMSYANEMGNESISLPHKIVQVAQKTWQKTGKKMVDFYQAEDNLFRLAVYIDRRNKGMDIQDATQEARRWLVDYDIDAPAINALRATALPFFAYTYRVVPLLAEAAVKTPWKFAALATAGWVLNEAGERYGGGDTRRERKLMPDQQKGSIYGLPFLPPQQIKLPTDKPQYLDVTRYIPGGDVFDVAGEGKAVPYLPAPVQPSFGAAGSFMQGLMGYDAFKKKPIRGMGISEAEDAKAKGKFLLQQFLPNNPLMPGSYAFEKIQQAAQGKASPLGDVLPVWQAVAQTVGVKIRPADLEKMILRAGIDAKQDISRIMAEAQAVEMDYRSGRTSKARRDMKVNELKSEARTRLEKYRKIIE